MQYLRIDMPLGSPRGLSNNFITIMHSSFCLPLSANFRLFFWLGWAVVGRVQERPKNSASSLRSVIAILPAAKSAVQSDGEVELKEAIHTLLQGQHSQQYIYPKALAHA